MKIQNINCKNYNAFFLIFFLSMSQKSNAGIINAAMRVLTTIDAQGRIHKKNIYILADRHDVGDELHGFDRTEESLARTVTPNERQLKECIAAIKETAAFRNENLHIFLEKPGVPTLKPQPVGTYKKGSNELQLKGKVFKSVMGDLDTEVVNEGLHGVTVEDVEIRKMAITAHNIFAYLKDCENNKERQKRRESEVIKEFLEKFPDCAEYELSAEEWQRLEDETRAFYYKKRFYDDAPRYGELTFQNIVDEYEATFSTLEQFPHTPHLEKRVADIWERQVDEVKERYVNFRKLLNDLAIKLHDKVFDSALRFFDANTPHYEKLKKYFNDDDGMSELFDSYLVKRIYEYPGQHIALVAGANHTAYVSFLLDQLDVEGRLVDYGSRYPYYFNPILISQSEMYDIFRGYAPAQYLTRLIQGAMAALYFRILSIGDSVFPGPEKPKK